jgi:hypothetical protein
MGVQIGGARIGEQPLNGVLDAAAIHQLPADCRKGT